MDLQHSGKAVPVAADKAEMDEKTARKHRDLGRLPSQCQARHDWRTRDGQATQDMNAEELVDFV